MELVTDIKNTTSYDELLAGPEIPVLTKNIKLQSGTAYKRGMLISLVKTEGEAAATEIGKQTATGEVAEYVLMRDADATDDGQGRPSVGAGAGCADFAPTAEIVGTVYVKGRFNREKIILADGDTVEAHEAELRLRDIHFTTLKS